MAVRTFPSVVYIQHLTHQTLKTTFIRSFKCHNIWYWWTVQSQIWDCSQIVKLILFFYLGGAHFFSSNFSVFLISLSFVLVSHSCSEPPTISLLSLSLSLCSMSLPPFLTKLRPEIHTKPSQSLSNGFFFFFFFGNLMVDLAMIVWVMDSAFWIGVQQRCVCCRLRF